MVAKMKIASTFQLNCDSLGIIEAFQSCLENFFTIFIECLYRSCFLLAPAFCCKMISFVAFVACFAKGWAQFFLVFMPIPTAPTFSINGFSRINTSGGVPFQTSQNSLYCLNDLQLLSFVVSCSQLYDKSHLP